MVPIEDLADVILAFEDTDEDEEDEEDKEDEEHEQDEEHEHDEEDEQDEQDEVGPGWSAMASMCKPSTSLRRREEKWDEEDQGLNFRSFLGSFPFYCQGQI